MCVLRGLFALVPPPSQPVLTFTSQQSLSVISVKTAAAAVSYGFVINKYEQQRRVLFSLKNCAQCGFLYTLLLTLCTVQCIYILYNVLCNVYIYCTMYSDVSNDLMCILCEVHCVLCILCSM